MNGLTSLRSLTGGFMMQGEKADSAEIEEDLKDRMDPYWADF